MMTVNVAVAVAVAVRLCARQMNWVVDLVPSKLCMDAKLGVLIGTQAKLEVEV